MRQIDSLEGIYRMEVRRFRSLPREDMSLSQPSAAGGEGVATRLLACRSPQRRYHTYIENYLLKFWPSLTDNLFKLL